MPYVKKFKKGSKFNDIHRLIYWIRPIDKDVINWTYYNDKPMHPGVIVSMQLHHLIHACRAGRLSKAIRMSSIVKGQTAASRSRVTTK